MTPLVRREVLVKVPIVSVSFYFTLTHMSRSPIARQLLRGQNSCFGQTILINSLLDWICITMFWNRDIQHLLRQRRKEHSNSSKFGPFTSSLHYERNPREYVPTMDPFLQTVAKQRVTNSFKSTKGMHSIIHLKGGGWLKQFGSLVSLCTRVTRVLLNHALIGDLRKRFIPNSNHSYPNGFRDLKTRVSIMNDCHYFTYDSEDRMFICGVLMQKSCSFCVDKKYSLKTSSFLTSSHLFLSSFSFSSLCFFLLFLSSRQSG